ncbi:LysR substrate-binding domain-containing protein [Amycolatopsis suaedae]|uniref:LysR family transcriptional regulator n=1 Tax=Amycolatopsis suaedae TaxID=2510978 RepID=A0A4Q7JA32_9PSEU|nr:LysR substrate-binding domain-containing protein [Amycolatopsis suaedae]RZQ63034.1 LysR family transcriptional regulator [Amycolatopsis suaedae]
MGLDLRKLDHLVAVVEEGSFTRAAARLHLSQQALSTSIRALEREVGVPLLDRTSAGVTPLPAGRALVEDARVLHGVARAAVRRARRIGRGETEVLRIGHTPAVTGPEVMALAQAVPGLHTEVHQRYPGQLTAELLGGELDVGLCRGIQPPHGLSRTTLGHSRLSVAVAAGHRLAGRTHVTLADLAGEHLVVWGSEDSGYTQFLLGLCRDAGFEPRHSRNPIQGTPPVTAVVGTGHVAFVTDPPGSALDGRVQVLELRPAQHAPVHALWSANHTGAMRDAFLSGQPASPAAARSDATNRSGR